MNSLLRDDLDFVTSAIADIEHDVRITVYPKQQIIMVDVMHKKTLDKIARRWDFEVRQSETQWDGTPTRYYIKTEYIEFFAIGDE